MMRQHKQRAKDTGRASEEQDDRGGFEMRHVSNPRYVFYILYY